MARFSPSKLYNLRDKQKLSYVALSKKTNGKVEQSYIAKLEKGEKTPTIDKISELSKALSISFLDLLDFDNSEITNYNNAN